MNTAGGHAGNRRKSGLHALQSQHCTGLTSVVLRSGERLAGSLPADMSSLSASSESPVLYAVCWRSCTSLWDPLERHPQIVLSAQRLP